MILTTEDELVAQGLINAVNEEEYVVPHRLQLWFFSHDNFEGRSIITVRCSRCALRQQFAIEDSVTGYESYWEAFFHMVRLCGYSFGKLLCKQVSV